MTGPGQYRVNRTQGKAKRRQLPLPVLLGAMLIAGLCALLALNTASAAQELKNRTLTDGNASASDQEQQLVRDLAAKQAPAALAAAARAQGLVLNPNPAFLRINADGSVTVLGAPMPATSVPPAATPASTVSMAPSPTATKSAKPSRTATPAKSAVPTKTGTPGKSGSVSKSATPARTVTVTKTATASASRTAGTSSAPRPSASPTSSVTAAPLVTGGH